MPIPKITAAQFATQLGSAITNINDGYDVDVGPIPDTIISPTAQVLENQNDRVREVSQLILLDQVSAFQDADVDAFVANESIERNDGGRSATVLVFSRAVAPTFDLTVQQGFPVATEADESTGQSIVFVTTEAKTLPAASASTYFNTQTQRYELEVEAQAVVTGSMGQVGPNRVKRPLRPLTGFDTVTNRAATSVVVDRETNTQLLQRYRLAIAGTQIAGRNGLMLYIMGKLPDAGDVLIALPDSSVVTRTGVGGNAVDVIITGAQTIPRTETAIFTGIGQVVVLAQQPVDSITSIPGYTAGVDYEFVPDTSGVSGSVRAQSGVRFLPGGICPAAGAGFTVNYAQNSSVTSAQALLNDPDLQIGGQDLLARLGSRVDVVIAAKLTVATGFNPDQIAAAIKSALVAFVGAYKLGQDVEKSDVDAQVRLISGVDNFVFNTFDRVGGSGNADISIAENEYARLLSTNITLT